MTAPLITAVAPRWEADLAGSLARSRSVHVARRCADVAELLGVAAAGLGRVAVVSSDLRRLDRSVIDTLHGHDVEVLGVHPPDDAAAARTLRRWGLRVVLAADATTAELDVALVELLDDSRRAQRPPASTVRRSDVTERTSAPDHPQAGQARAGEDVRAQAAGATGGTGGTSGHRWDRGGGSLAGDSRAGDSLEEGVEGALEPETEGSEHGEDQDGQHGDGEHEPGEQRRGEVIVVWGPGGSPGRTTVAVNLAAELGDPLTPVVLVDADTYGASVGQHLAILDEVPGIAAAARLADQGGLDRSTLADLAPEARPGMRVLTGLPRADRWPELRDPALADVLEACRELARWTVVDVAANLEQDEELSFDTLAPRRNGAALTALDAADKVVVVGTGDPVGLQRLVRGLDLLAQRSSSPRTVVVTRVRAGSVGRDPGRRIAEALDRFAGVRSTELIPEDQESLDAALLHGQALAEARPKSPARLAIAALAEVVVGQESALVVRRGAGARGRGLFRRATT